MTSPTTSDRSAQAPADWRREYAYTLGEQAFIYGFPYVYNARLRYDWVTQKPSYRSAGTCWNPSIPRGTRSGRGKTLNEMLAENPPAKHHELLLKQFAEIGVGPGLDVEARPEPVKQGLIAAAKRQPDRPLLDRRPHPRSGDGPRRHSDAVPAA